MEEIYRIFALNIKENKREMKVIEDNLKLTPQ